MTWWQIGIVVASFVAGWDLRAQYVKSRRALERIADELRRVADAQEERAAR